MSEIKIGGLAGTCSQEISIKETTNAGNIIINNCTFGKAKIWLDPMCYLLNSVAHKNINTGHINITNNKFSTYDLYILPQENNYTNTGHINITDNSNNGCSKNSLHSNVNDNSKRLCNKCIRKRMINKNDDDICGSSKLKLCSKCQKLYKLNKI